MLCTVPSNYTDLAERGGTSQFRRIRVLTSCKVLLADPSVDARCSSSSAVAYEYHTPGDNMSNSTIGWS